jgi:glyoxylase-like metal-dependent hydrolase (beta-lactamase superfamily II)
MIPLSAGVGYLDLNFLGEPGIIATAVLQGPEGVALIDPGPSTTLEMLTRSLAAHGFATTDVRAILLTHIHLDHAGATGSLLQRCPHATVYVHERGAPHLVDPSKLLASASRLYGADMERLWGEVLPVPKERVHVLGTGLDLWKTPGTPLRPRPGSFPQVETRPLTVLGHQIAWASTPGHASHHVSYFLPAGRIAFVGDTAGICRQSGRVVLPATPPPDIDLEAWRRSTDLILGWEPDQLFLTHFGPQPSPRVHFNDLWKRMDAWSRRVQGLLATAGTDEDRARTFMNEVMDELTRATSPQEALAYVSAGRFDFSWTGLARYWRKQI